MNLTSVFAIVKKHMEPLAKDSPLSTKELDILFMRGMADLCLWLAEEREAKAPFDIALETYPGSARENGNDFGTAVAHVLLELREELHPEETPTQTAGAVNEDDPDDLTDAD